MITLQNAIDQVRCCEDLSERRRRDLVSALRTVARLLGRDPGQIPAHLPVLRRALAQAGPATFDMSPKRLANVRSEVSFALKRLSGIPKRRQPEPTNFSANWEALLSSCPTKELRWRLLRFSRWCSEDGVEPVDADAAVLARFVSHSDASNLAIDPEALRRQTVAAWARCARTVPDWPAQPLGPPAQRAGWAFKLTEFPESFQADVALWLGRLAGQDLLAEDGPIRPLRPASLHHHQKNVRISASALVLQGVPMADLQSLADVVTVERVRMVVRWSLARHGGPTQTIHNLAYLLRSIARHHVKMPEQDLAKLADICRRVAVTQHGLTKKNRDRLRPFNDQRRMDLLITLPQELMRRARLRGRSRFAAARDAREAVAIEILLTAAPRIANLAGLRLGKHILFDTARPDRVGLVLDEHETKNGSIVDLELPAESSRLVRHYVERYLPILAKPGSDHLFPGQTGGSMQPAALGKRITAVIREATGCEVNPHLMRHLGAKGHLDANPGEYEVVRRVLGHQSMNTTTNHYTGLESGAAARHFDAGLLARRRDAELRLGRRHRRSST